MKSRLIDKDWCCERLRAVEGDDRGWDGWMVSPTPWTWVWVNSRRWWRTEKPGVLQSMESQKVRHDLVSEQWTRTISMPLGFQETEMKQSVTNRFADCKGLRWGGQGFWWVLRYQGMGPWGSWLWWTAKAEINWGFPGVTVVPPTKDSKESLPKTIQNACFSHCS